MYKNILVAIDPTHGESQEAALRMALHMAEDADAQITAITVMEPIPAIVVAEAPVDILDRGADRAMEELRKLVGDRSEIKTVLRHGSPGAEIVNYAREHDCDLIVLASHKPGLADYFLGSTAARVVRHAACSVHVIR